MSQKKSVDCVTSAFIQYYFNVVYLQGRKQYNGELHYLRMNYRK